MAGPSVKKQPGDKYSLPSDHRFIKISFPVFIQRPQQIIDLEEGD
jgi:hypothetical protein